MNANEKNSSGSKRSRLKREAQTLQKRRLVQKCQCKRISLLPHSQQKFGWYTAQISALKVRSLFERRGINWIERRDYMPGAGNVDSFASKATETDCLEL